MNRKLDFLSHCYVCNRAGKLRDLVLPVLCTTSHSNKNSPAFKAGERGILVYQNVRTKTVLYVVVFVVSWYCRFYLVGIKPRPKLIAVYQIYTPRARSW